MKFTLTIDCDNAAFEDDRNGEVARILRKAAEKIERGDYDLPSHAFRTQYQTIFDANGNDVGRASYVREE